MKHTMLIICNVLLVYASINMFVKLSMVVFYLYSD